jgi:group II intron reverse transcriptase/maturase
MRNAETVLGIIRVRGEKRLPLEDVYRQLFNPDLYLKAYGKIYRNTGAMTPGTTDETADGMSLTKIEKIIEAIRTEKFQWTSVKRVYIPKEDGKQRPLGLPTWTDKLVQEVLRLILEAYYEPQFSDGSHGFRPERSCDTALCHIYYNWRGTKWFVEGDIKGFYDNIDHEVLLSILSEKIHDHRFLRLVMALCNAGYCEDWKYHATLSGVPQGGIVSPILANIYLDKLDKYIEEELIPAHTRGTERGKNPEYDRLRDQIYYHRKRGNLARADELVQQRRSLPSLNPDDPNYSRLRYVRYADDFLLGFAGPKAETLEIKAKIKEFLKEKLRLELSEEKTLITHARTERARFLSYEIYEQHADDKMTGNRRSINGGIGLKMPMSFLERICQRYMQNGKVIHRAERLNDDDFSIISQYQSELRGYYQYYQLASNVSSFHKAKWVMETSLTKTLAAKHKTSVNKIVKKYKTSIETPHGLRKCLRLEIPREGKKPLVAVFGGISICRNMKAVIKDQAEHTFNARGGRTELIKRLLADECEACGDTGSVAVHHIRALKDLQVKGRKEKPEWMKVMAARRRKTMVLCLECHRKLHAGQPLVFRD